MKNALVIVIAAVVAVAAGFDFSQCESRQYKSRERRCDDDSELAFVLVMSAKVPKGVIVSHLRCVFPRRS